MGGAPTDPRLGAGWRVEPLECRAHWLEPPEHPGSSCFWQVDMNWVQSPKSHGARGARALGRVLSRSCARTSLGLRLGSSGCESCWLVRTRRTPRAQGAKHSRHAQHVRVFRGLEGLQGAGGCLGYSIARRLQVFKVEPETHGGLRPSQGLREVKAVHRAPDWLRR